MKLFDKTKKEEQKKSAPKTKKSEAVVEVAAPIETKNDNKKKIIGVLLEPLITEKAAVMAQQNKYVFVVSDGANKILVSQAVESRYGIKPKQVNIMKYEGKYVRRGRSFGKTKNWKKAIVTLPEGKSIQIYEGV